jgi:hypothetical protein
MGMPEQFFQLRTAKDASMLQRDPIDTRPVRCRHDTLFFQKFAKSLRPGGERQHCSSILGRIELRKHLAAVLLRTDPEDELVAPSPGLASSLDDMG